MFYKHHSSTSLFLLLVFRAGFLFYLYHFLVVDFTLNFRLGIYTKFDHNCPSSNDSNSYMEVCTTH